MQVIIVQSGCKSATKFFCIFTYALNFIAPVLRLIMIVACAYTLPYTSPSSCDCVEKLLLDVLRPDSSLGRSSSLIVGQVYQSLQRRERRGLPKAASVVK